MIASLSDRVANGLGDEDLDDPRRVYSVFVDNVACCYGPAGRPRSPTTTAPTRP